MEARSTRRELLKYSVGTFMLPSVEESWAAPANMTALLADPIYQQHDPGAGHPERPERYAAVTQALDRSGLTKSLSRIESRSATEDEIAACHTRAYLQTVKREIAAGARELSTGDTNIGPRT